MTAENLKNWLKGQDSEVAERISVGSIDGSKERFIGVYDAKDSAAGQRLCLGGIGQTRWLSRRFTVLVHWTDNAVVCAAKARAIHALLYAQSNVVMDGVSVAAVDPGGDVIALGRDEKGIYEYSINVTITYRRS